MKNFKHLREFIENDLRSVDYVKHQLESSLGVLRRVGGDDRIYQVDGTNQKAELFIVGDSVAALGIAYSKNKVETLYWWNHYDLNEPDYAIDIPANGQFSDMLPTIIDMLHTQPTGKVEI